MKKVVYTCITGAYDILRQPLATRPDWDYICFTDKPEAKSDGVWQLRPVPTVESSPKVRSAYVKLLPHKVLPEYDLSLFMDANLQIASDVFYEKVEEKLSSERTKVGMVPHSTRDCIYDEAAACFDSSLSGFCDILRLRRHLRRDRIPRHIGLYETNIVLRKHTDPEVIAVDEAWWKAFSEGIPRDQLSATAVLYKAGISPDLLFGPGLNARNVEFVNYYPHVGKRPRRTGLPRAIRKFLLLFLR